MPESKQDNSVNNKWIDHNDREYHILFLLHLPPPVHGSSIAGETVKRSTILNKRFQCTFLNLLTSTKIKESGKFTPRKLISFLKQEVAFLKAILSHKPDLCYMALTFKGIAFYRDLLLIFQLKLLGIKRIYHLHMKGIEGELNKRLKGKLLGYVFKSSKVILLSKLLYGDIQKVVPLRYVCICPNGLPDIYVEKKKTDPDKPIKILFLANLFESKGIYTLIEALGILNREEIQFECLIIGAEGDITTEELNSKITQFNLNNKVKYLGKKFGKEKLSILSEVDMLVHPTQNDSFGLVILEAMRNYLPVVASIEGGIPDLIDDNITGFLTPKNSSEMFAEKIKILIEEPKLRQKMGIAGQKRFKKYFTSNCFEHRLSDILSEALAETY